MIDCLTPRLLSASGERSLGGSCRWSGRFGGAKNLFSLARFEPQFLGCPARNYSLFEAMLADVLLAADTVQKLLHHLLKRRHVDLCCPVTVVMLRSSKYCTCYIAGNHIVAECYVLKVLLFICSFTCLTTLSVSQTIYSRGRQDDSILGGV